MWLRTGCSITFDVSIATPFILMLRPRSGIHQRVARESYTLKPSVSAIEYTDNFGNLCQRLEVNQQREGLCRKLAHLCIALCRGLCIPARMVAGYLHQLDPMDFHTWLEAYVGGRWYIFDANQTHPASGRITVAYGRDAADAAIFNKFGPALYPRKMSVHVEILDSAAD